MRRSWVRARPSEGSCTHVPTSLCAPFLAHTRLPPSWTSFPHPPPGSDCGALEYEVNGRWWTAEGDSAGILLHTFDPDADDVFEACVSLCEAAGVDGVCAFKIHYSECWFSPGAETVGYQDRYTSGDDRHYASACTNKGFPLGGLGGAWPGVPSSASTCVSPSGPAALPASDP